MRTLPPDSDLDDENTPQALPVPYGALGAALALLLGYAPLALLVGLCGVGRGARWYAPHFAALLPVYFVVFSCVVHALLVWPVVNLAYPGRAAQFRPLVRALVVTALVSLPLFSFAYYLGTFRAGVDYGDIALMIFPAAAIAALFFEATRRPWLFTLTLSAATFIPLFVLNDILGPLPAVWNYSSRGIAFYWLRMALPVAAIGIPITWVARDRPSKRADLRMGAAA